MTSVIGRTGERSLILHLLEDARSGSSGALVLTGGPGIGKSVLLGEAVDLAEGMRVLRATGVETEIDLAFAGLDQLLRPVLAFVERLPALQRDTLLGALGRIEYANPDRFEVAVATLALLAECAEERPVLCVVDDAQWLDRPSTEALAFAARRLEAERIAVLIATREAGWPGLRELPVGTLGPDDAVNLLREHVGGVAPAVQSRLVEVADGNPLALVELAGELSPGQLAGTEPLPRLLPLTSRIRELFLGRVRELPEAGQRLLLVAAADDTGEAAVIFRAAASLGAAPGALDAAERTGLVTVGLDGTLTFRHPLVRTCVYQDAPFTARIEAHRALADALTSDEHAERRVWHLAASAAGPSAEVARDLEQTGARARQRGGYAVAAAAFERAAALSPDRADRGRLLLAAAQAVFTAGDIERAMSLAGQAQPLVTDPADAKALTLLRGRIEFASGSAVTAHSMLLAAAQAMGETDPRGAAPLIVEAARAAWNAYDPTRYAEAAQLLTRLVLPADDPLAPVVATTVAISSFIDGRPAAPIARMRQVLDEWLPRVSHDRPPERDPEFMEASLALAGFTRVLADDDAGLTLGRSAVSECRTRGLVGWLPWALANVSMTESIAGRLPAADADAAEGLQLAQDLGLPTAICSCEASLAWIAAVRGDEDACRKLTDDVLQLAAEYRLASIAVTATWGLGLLELSLGRPERAFHRLSDPIHGPLAVPNVRCLITPDLVEAAVRAGRADDVADAFDWFVEWAAATEQPVAEAAVLRCRALLDDERAEEYYQDALRHHDQAGAHQRPLDRARTQLLYGQWLRRARRRMDARSHLSAAHRAFELLGANPWADRAATELRATGQNVTRDHPIATRLTAQEIQIVKLVAEGASNQEAAVQLFLSPRTVAYHLYKAYPKLGITSRTELARLNLEDLLA